MNQISLKPLCDELAVRLQELIVLQDRLHTAIQTKLEAMRRANVDGMLAASRVERDLVQEVSRSDESRRDTVGRLCKAVGLNTAGRSVSLRILAARLDAASRDRLLRMAGALRERMLAVGEANRVVELVCREMMVHFKTLFVAMVADRSEPLTYRASGDMGRMDGARVLDQVG